jgi:tetratricopeptide (TPR) repeat protein
MVEPGDSQGYCAFTAIISGGKAVTTEHLKHYFLRSIHGKDPINSQVHLEEVIQQALHVGGGGENVSPLSVFTAVLKLSNCAPDVFIAAFVKFVNNKFGREFAALDPWEKDEFKLILTRIQQNAPHSDRKELVLECLFKLYREIDLFDECLLVLKECLEEYGPLRTILDHLGLCYEKKSEFSLAYEYFEKSYTLDPSHTWAREGMIRVKYRARPEKTGATFSVSKSINT